MSQGHLSKRGKVLTVCPLGPRNEGRSLWLQMAGTASLRAGSRPLPPSLSTEVAVSLYAHIPNSGRDKNSRAQVTEETGESPGPALFLSAAQNGLFQETHRRTCPSSWKAKSSSDAHATPQPLRELALPGEVTKPSTTVPTTGSLRPDEETSPASLLTGRT